MKKTFAKKYGILLIIVVGGMFIFLLSAISFRDQTILDVSDEMNALEIKKNQEQVEVKMSEDTLDMNVGGLMQNLKLFYGEKDVTREAFWYSDDPTIASVNSNDDSEKGLVFPSSEGTTYITAVYEERGARSLVNVKIPALQVRCAGGPDVGKVGEPIMFTGFYTEEGVPPYTYEWSTSSGEIFGEMGRAEKFYQESGEKKVIFKTTDMLGNSASAECSVNIKE